MVQALQGDVSVGATWCADRHISTLASRPHFRSGCGGVLEDCVRVPAFGITLIPYNM